MITVHSGWENDFSSLGLCPLTPTECTVEEEAGGLYQLKMIHPMDETGRWWHLQNWNIIKAPAPVRETPLLYLYGKQQTTAVQREIYKVRVNSRLRLRTKPSTSEGKVIGRYKNGTKVIKIGSKGGWLQVIVQSGGATGWMHGDYLTYVGTETQEVPGEDTPPMIVEPRQIRDQLFRITSVDRDDANQEVTVTAQHVFFDLLGNVIADKCAPEEMPADQAVEDTFGKAFRPHGFGVYANTRKPVTGEYTGRSLVSALTETDGIVQQAHARLVRDNFDVFVLEDEMRDRGVEIRHGKNMLGAILTEDVSAVVTYVIPVGKDKDGKPLYLDGERYVKAPNVDELPVVRAKEIAYNVKSGSDEFPDDKAARAELRRLAELEFTENGIHMPTVGLEVDFVALENTRQYADYAPLQSVHLYDTVRVISARSGISARVRMTGYVYNCLTYRYDGVTLGTLFSLDSTVSGFDITQGSVSGNRLIPGSVDGSAVRDGTLYYAKIHQAAIEQLNVNSITAITARFAEIAAGSITTDALYASLADIVTLMVGDITADSITTDQLAAVLGDFVKLYADIAGIDFAAVRDLDADEAIFRVGTALELYVDRLAVTSANIVSAMLGDLVLRGSDGKYYRVVIGADGTITTEETAVSDGEIASGSTSGGQAIVGTTANIANLNAQSIKAASATIAEIFASALTAGKITAGQALIASVTSPELYTTAIKSIGDNLELTANKSIQFLITTNDLVRAYFAFTEDGIRTQRPGSAYATLVNDVGFHIIQQSEIIASFAKRRLEVETVAVGPVSSSQPRMILTHAEDGGLLITREDWI